MKTKIEKWAEETFQEYETLTKDYDIGFYSQSPLTNINHPVKVVVMGINPGSSGSFSKMINSSVWKFNESEKPYCHLLRGNAYWSERDSWVYWRNVMGLLSEAYPDIRENEQADCVFTNATFFNTPKAKDVFERLYDKTLPHTMKLIEILSPEFVVCLSPDNFARMQRTLGRGFLFREVFGRRLMIGTYNGKLYISIYHPAYHYSTEYKKLVRKALKIISKNPMLDLVEMSDKLQWELHEEWCEVNAPKPIRSNALKQMAIDCLSILKEKFPNAKADKEKLAFPLNDIIQIMVVAQSNNQYVYIRHIDWKDKIHYDSTTDNLDAIYPKHKEISTLLTTRGYAATNVALGKKPMSSYGVSSAEELAEVIYNEIQYLKDRLKEILK